MSTAETRVIAIGLHNGALSRVVVGSKAGVGEDRESEQGQSAFRI